MAGSSPEAAARQAAGARTARAPERRLPLALVGVLSLAAWGVLAAWSASPYARYLDHGGWDRAGALAVLCRSVPQGEIVIPVLVYALAWLVMITAMMLPTTLPLLSIFNRVTASRADAGGLMARVVAGYAVAWLGFGLLAHGLDSVLHLIAGNLEWLVARSELVGAAVLVGAGAFQFSALKYRCLERCRTPFAFINERWHGRRPSREAFRIGFDHGVFCVGCCWALMLVMFVVGMGNLGWMLLLAAAMAAEKNLPWGRRLRTPIGLGLIAWGGTLAAAAF
jgi:predicted metal-binding membrane protein